MQTATTGYDLVLDPAAYAGIDLPSDDGVPMDTPWHRACMNLLIDSVLYHCRGRTDFYTGGNMFIYFNPDQARNLDYRGPDFFYVKDGVKSDRERDYWAVWEENGRRPDVIVELLSPTTEREDRTTKFTIYEQTLRTPEYFVYSPDTERLEGWRLIGGSYAPLTANEQGWLWSAELELWLGTWVGEFTARHATWLRMYTAAGELVPVWAEANRQLAEQERQRAEQERQRAERECQRAEQERQHAEQERQHAEQERQHAEQERQHAEQERQRAEQERQRADRLEEEVARLRALLQPPPSQTNGTQPK